MSLKPKYPFDTLLAFIFAFILTVAINNGVWKIYGIILSQFLQTLPDIIIHILVVGGFFLQIFFYLFTFIYLFKFLRNNLINMNISSFY